MKVTIAYEHDPADHGTIHLAVAPRATRPSPDSWKPALRDTVDGRRVVWARFEHDAGVAWVKDRNGERQTQRLT